MIKSKLFIGFMVAVMGLPVMAQNTVTGYIANANDSLPVAEAMVSYKIDNRESFVFTDSLGCFSIPDDMTGKDSVNYYITHIAFHPVTVRMASNRLDTVYLKPLDYIMDEVLVKGRQVTHKEGVTTVNVSAIPNIGLYQTDQMMRQLPGIISSGNGAYTLNGIPATIFINGVQQTISPTSLQSFLSGLPASAVASVKLQPVNTGRYNTSVKAVIDITIKDNIPLGYIAQPSVYASYRDDELNNVGADLFFMQKKGRWLYHNSLSYDNGSQKQLSVDSTLIDNRLFSSTGTQKTGRSNVIRYQGSYTYYLHNNDKLFFDAFIYNDWGTADSYWQNIGSTSAEKSKARNDLYNLAASYSIPSDKKIFNGIVTYSLSYGGRHDNMYFPGGHTGKTVMDGWMNNLTVSFNTTLDKFSIDYGGQIDYNSVEDKSSYNIVTDIDPQSHFKGYEVLSSAYLQGRYRFTDSFSLLGTLRVENTCYHYKQDHSAGNKTSFTDVFPSFMVNMDLPSYNMSLGVYSQIARPNYRDMLPGVKTLNDYIYTKGNPSLVPTDLYTLFFNNTLFGFFDANFSYTWASDAVADIYNISQGNMVITKVNGGDCRLFRSNFVLPFSLMADKLRGQLQFDASYKEIYDLKNGFTLPKGRKNSYWLISYNANVNYNPVERLSIMLTSSFSPKAETVLYDANSLLSVRGDLLYSLLKDKNLTLSLSVDNLFGTDYRKTSYFLSHRYYLRTMNLGPEITFSIKWRFNKGQHVDEEYRDYTPRTSRF